MQHESNPAQPGSPKLGVLLANTGSPDSPTPQAVKQYLAQFLMDEHVIPMNRVPWWLILHLFILPKRSKTSAERYRAIWTDDGSPLIAAHRWLAAQLEQQFEHCGLDVTVRYGMNYGNPSLETALTDLKQAGCTQLLVLPTYPQQSYSASKAVEDHVVRAAEATGWTGSYHLISNYHDDPIYIEALAASVREGGFNAAAGDHLLFAIHSVPVKDIAAGDPYEKQANATCSKVAQALGLTQEQWTLAYQCRFDKSRDWLEPTTKTALDTWVDALSAQGERAAGARLFVICPGFAVECLETLFDIGEELKPYYGEKLADAGLSAQDHAFAYIPCLGESERHVAVLQHVLQSAPAFTKG